MTGSSSFNWQNQVSVGVVKQKQKHASLIPPPDRGHEEEVAGAEICIYLSFDVETLIIAVRSCPQRGTGSVSAGDTSAFCEILLALGLSDLNLLFLTATTQLIRFEDTFGFVLVATMLRDIPFGHDGEMMTAIRLT
jgi:hypothetical protein